MDCRLIHGDCLPILKSMFDNSIDMIMNDLPFNYQGGEVSTSSTSTSEKYLSFLTSVTNEEFRVLKPGGNLVVINNPSNIFRTAGIYSKFIFRNGVPLIRPSTFAPAWHLAFKHNYMLFLCKDNVKLKWYGNRTNHNKESLTDVWNHIRYSNGFRIGKFWHPQAIHEDLTKQILELTTIEKDIVLDPFMGSGTTGIVCQKMNRNFVGIEIDDGYYEMARMRLGLLQK